jgi:hypothetical protein
LVHNVLPSSLTSENKRNKIYRPSGFSLFMCEH